MYGFFDARRHVDFGLSGGAGSDRIIEYTNIAPIFATVISARMVTLHELDTVYGLEDVFDMLEIIAIDNHNRNVLNKRD